MKIPMVVRRHGAASVEEVVQTSLSAPSIDNEQPFYVVDVQDIMKKHKTWTINMPRVRPFYAIKCNTSPIVLEVLASLGTGFDCASKGEIDTVLGMGVSASDIIYANPCKTKSYVKHAYEVGVDLMTFDNEPELYKVAQIHPTAKMVLRIKVDDSHAVCRFSAKFGAEVNDAEHLLTVAKQLGIEVVGVSFHVGSGCEDASSYNKAIADAAYVFGLARSMGFDMTLLDLGGGWPGTSNPPVSFEEIAKVCSEALELYFPEEDENGFKSEVNIIAEPGRYYVASAFTLATMIIAKRMVIGQDGQTGMMYYLNDGVYGSFNCTIFDHWAVTPVPFLQSNQGSASSNRQQFSTTLWGPTCDSMDIINKDVLLPEMDVGEWIVFKEMGAYTIAAASTFNGFELPSLKYYLPCHTLEALRNSPSWPRIAKVVEFDDDGELTSDDEGLELTSNDGNQPQAAIETDHQFDFIPAH